MIKRLMIWLIRGYKRFISPLLGDNCRFYPTCSVYAMQALEVHGVFKGTLLAIPSGGRGRTSLLNTRAKRGACPT